MMNTKWVWVFLCGFVPGLALAAADDAATTAGKAKSALCQKCHGADGNSHEPTIPKLAGQHRTYMLDQLRDIQAGKRAHPSMDGLQGKTTADLRQIARYFSFQPQKADLVSGNQAKIQAGELLYLKGRREQDVFACVECHKERGKVRWRSPMTSDSFIAMIGGQHKQYLVNQLKAFREGKRKNGRLGMMQRVAKNLTDAEIENLAIYLSGQAS